MAPVGTRSLVAAESLHNQTDQNTTGASLAGTQNPANTPSQSPGVTNPAAQRDVPLPQPELVATLGLTREQLDARFALEQREV